MTGDKSIYSPKEKGFKEVLEILYFTDTLTYG